MTLHPDSFRRLYDFEPHFLQIGGHRMHYLDEGSGSPILMLHGNPSWSFMYRDLLRSLRDSRRVLVPDQIGCGLSEKPSVRSYPFTLERRIRDLDEFITSLQLEGPLALVLHDWGGLIGMGYAGRNPDRVSRLVILNTAAFRVPRGKPLHWTLRWCRKSSLAAFLMRRFGVFSLAAVRLGTHKGLPEEVRAGYLAPHGTPEDRTAVVRFVQDIPLEREHPSYAVLLDVERDLERLKGKPMLICWGERDFIFDRSFLEEWQERFPEAEVIRFEESGHYLLEDEGPEATTEIRRFLERTEGSR